MVVKGICFLKALSWVFVEIHYLGYPWLDVYCYEFSENFLVPGSVRCSVKPPLDISSNSKVLMKRESRSLFAVDLSFSVLHHRDPTDFHPNQTLQLLILLNDSLLTKEWEYLLKSSEVWLENTLASSYVFTVK